MLGMPTLTTSLNIFKNNWAKVFIVQINVHQLTANNHIINTLRNTFKKPWSAHKCPRVLTIPCHITIDQGKTSELELDMATVQERRNKEFEEDKEMRKHLHGPAMEEMFMRVEMELLMMLGRTPPPKRCRAYCSEKGAIRSSSNHSHISGAYMQDAMVEWLLGSSDNSCWTAQTDPWRPPCTMPSAARSTPLTNLMKELKKLAVKKIVVVMKRVNYSTMISEEKQAKQPPVHSSQ
jgi:hypothetical protein